MVGSERSGERSPQQPREIYCSCAVGRKAGEAAERWHRASVRVYGARASRPSEHPCQKWRQRLATGFNLTERGATRGNERRRAEEAQQKI